ncbi:MAG: GMC family oxidoreductase [Pseudomonadota bacterium]
MFLDARSLHSDLPEMPDICIVGAGIAGLVLARALAESGLSVWLLESGGKKVERRPQSLNEGRSNLGDYPFVSSRVRAFGGTSTRWTGACVELDPGDFDARDWVPHSGWPFGKEELDDHYAAARADFGISPVPHYDAHLARSPLNGSDLEARTVAYSAPLDIGRRYKKLVAESRTVHCVLNATVTELFLSACGTRVARVACATPDGDSFEVTARAVVLASGGIENARLLLASNATHIRGLGNIHDTLGRYHMEHPIKVVGVLPIGDRAGDLRDFTNRRVVNGTEVQGTFGLSRATRRRESLFDMHLRAYRYSALEDDPAIIRGKRATAPEASGARRQRDIARDMLAALRPQSAAYLGWHLRNKLCERASFDHVRFMAFVEQEPDPENRIMLANDRDRFDKPLPHLSIRESETMQRSVRLTMSLMEKALLAAGFGRLRHGDDALAHLTAYDAYGLHQMGSTRMSDNPRHGVVDRNCRIHGLSNAFVAGSSVFPTGGASNPTWTIAALARRLARHLEKEVPAL